MEQEIEHLVACFGRGSAISWKQDSPFELQYDGEMKAVIAREYIPTDTCLGYLEGLPMYVWDMNHSEYVFVQHDLVLDVSQLHPRPLLTLMRSEDESENHSNCMVIVEHNHDTHETRFPVYTTRPIRYGDEIVYQFEAR